MSDETLEPLAIAGFVDAEIGTPDHTGRIHLPIKLNRKPTEWEFRAAVEHPTGASIRPHARQANLTVANREGIAEAVNNLRTFLEDVSRRGPELEAKAREAAERAREKAATEEDKIREALLAAGVAPVQPGKETQW